MDGRAFHGSEFLMLKVVYFPEVVPQKTIIDWKVGQDTNKVHGVAKLVLCVSADGQELLFVLQNFQNIHGRTYNGKPQTWYGDDAKFIAANL